MRITQYILSYPIPPHPIPSHPIFIYITCIALSSELNHSLALALAPPTVVAILDLVDATRGATCFHNSLPSVGEEEEEKEKEEGWKMKGKKDRQMKRWMDT
jgi:hypothetical protein